MNHLSMIDNAIQHWGQIAPLVAPAHSETEYQRLVNALDQVLDVGGADQTHPLALLAEYLGDRISEWEADDEMPDAASGVEMLHHLMTEQGLRQSDLPEIGSQGVISEILAGRRELNLRQMRALAKQFKVPVQWFL